MGILDFFSREAGQQRRRALDEAVTDLFTYLTPPNLRPAASTVAQMNPIQSMSDAMQAGGVLFDPEATAEARKRAALDMGVEIAMTVTPAALAKMGYLTAPQALAETFAAPSGMTQADVKDLFPEEAYHFMKSNRMIGDVLRPPSDYASKFDRLGVHVGTPAQAEDRYRVQVGSGSREDIDRDLTLLGKDTGMTLPLQLRTDKPFEIKDFKEFGIDPDVSHSSRSFEIDGKTVLSEDGVRAVLNEFADARNLDLDTARDVFRKELTDKGYTNIPYVNMIEGVKRSETYVPDPKFKPENISNIMLVDRTAGDPAVIKSRFAAFRDAYDPSIMAAVPIGGLLGYNMLSQQQAERNNQGLLY